MKEDTFEKIIRDFKGEQSDLIPVLQRVQKAEGYLSPEGIRRISRWLRVSENEVFGVATFYAQFRFTPPGRHHLKVCLGTACHVRGGEQLLSVIDRRLEIKPGGTTTDGKYDLERVACLGCCALAPVVSFDDRVHSQMSVLKLIGMLDEHDGDR
jgi:NADH-quinone oxidoreductase subunit E